MSLHYKDKCLVCLKTGGNINIFTTYNTSAEKEELYVDVINKCFNIEITLDSGLHEMCNNCSLKLQKAYNFRQCIIEAVNKLVLAKVSETSDNVKQYSDIEYIDDIPLENVYDVETVLSAETDQISYNLDKINDDQNDNYSNRCAFSLDDNDEDKNGLIKVGVGEDIKTEESTVGPLITLNQADLISFTLDNTNANKFHNDNQITYFMDLGNVLDVDVSTVPNETDTIIQNIEKKNQADIVTNHDESYSLNILNENVLNTFLMDENDIPELNIGNNSVNHIMTKDINEKPETALIPESSYIPFVLNNESDKKASIINVTKVVIANVDDVSKTSKCRRIIRKVVSKKKKKANSVVEICPVSNNVDKINENKVTNLNSSGTVDTLPEKKESVVKKTVKRKYKSKTVLNPESGQISYTLHKLDENDQSNCSVDVLNDLPEKKEVKKAKRDKKTVKNKKDIKDKDTDTVKENVPGKVKDVKPKRKKIDPKVDPIAQFYIMPGHTECTVCGAQFENTVLLCDHMRTHPPEYVCAVCGTTFETKFKHKVHMRTHEKGPFYCKHCNQEFSNVNTRNTHEWRVHSKPEPFKCSHCGERFKTYLRRLRHLQSVHGDTPEYPCQFCGKIFAYAAYRKKHVEIMHLDTRPYQCEQCPATFARRGGLDSHLASKHGIGERKYQCDVCSQRFFVQTALRWHVGQVHNRHACSHCEERFETATALDLHSRTHESLDMSMSLDIMSSLPLDVLADDYALMDSAYLDLNEL